MIEPAVSLVRRIFPARQTLSERQYLYLTIVFLLVLWLLGLYLVPRLVAFLNNLPI